MKIFKGGVTNTGSKTVDVSNSVFGDTSARGGQARDAKGGGGKGRGNNDVVNSGSGTVNLGGRGAKGVKVRNTGTGKVTIDGREV